MDFMEYLNSFRKDDIKFKRTQLRTNICQEDLYLTPEEKYEVENEVQKILRCMSYEEINSMVESWLNNPYGTEIDTYRISLLEDALFHYHSEKINLEQEKAQDDINMVLRKSTNLAEYSSKCR